MTHKPFPMIEGMKGGRDGRKGVTRERGREGKKEGWRERNEKKNR
jgi:hypothetical protein